MSDSAERNAYREEEIKRLNEMRERAKAYQKHKEEKQRFHQRATEAINRIDTLELREEEHLRQIAQLQQEVAKLNKSVQELLAYNKLDA